MRALRPVLHPACAAVLLAGALVDLPALAQTTQAPKRADTPGYPEPVIQWGVQKDETCDQVAVAVWGSVKHAALVTRYNRVRCAPGVALPVGTTLVLPEKPTTLPTARLGAVNPSVRSHPAGGGWAPAETGAPLYTNHVVNTLDKGRADIRFVDRTRVYMAANTLVVVYGTAAQTSVSKAPPPVVQVDAGEVKVGLAALRGDDAVDIGVAGGGRVSAHTREAVVEKKGQRTTVAVYDGKARVTSAGKSVDVPEKFASRFVGAAPPSPPRPLPPAPAWVTASVGGPVVGSASDDGLRLFPAGKGVVSATWASVPDARAYRFEIARDEGFHDLIAREEVAGDVHAFRAERLPPGTYWYAVRAIDKEDYLGLATPRRVRIAAGRIEAAPGTVEGAVDASPYGVLVLDRAPSLEISVDGGPFGPMPPSIDLARRHPAKIALREGQITTELAVHYRPARAVVRAEPGAADRLRVAVRFEGLDGVDVEARVHPSLKVTRVAGDAREVPLARSGDAFVADVPARGTIARIDVVDGRGRWLGRGEVDASAPPSRGKKTPLAGPATYVAPALSALTDVAPFAPTPHDAAGFAATIAGRSTGGGAQGLVFASGGVGPLGVDAAVRTGGTGDALVADGGAWLGARARVLRLGDAAVDDRGAVGSLVEVAPALRVGLPFVGSDPPVRLEPAVAVGGVRGRLSFLADAGARVRVGDATAARAPVPQVEPLVAGGASYDVLPWLRASALLDAEVLVKQPGTSSSALFRGGLTLGAEAGGAIYGGAFARVSPFPEDGGVVAGQLAIGVRGR